MAIPLLQIPGNIKQQFLPFVLNPQSKLHEFVASSTCLNNKNIAPQFFSYRETNVDYSSGKALLQFYPSSLNTIKFNDDISYKLLYSNDANGEHTNNSLQLSDVLNCIPGVSIREFLPDTRLDQCINMFVDLVSNMTKLFTSDDKASTSNSGDVNNAKKSDEDSWATKFKKIMEAVWYTMKYMVGSTNPNFYDDLELTESNYLQFSNYNNEIYTKVFGEQSKGMYVMTFPYLLYYKLQSCVTTNIYEVPAITSDKRIISSSGKAGWTDGGSDFMSAGGFRVSSLMSKIPLIGDLMNMIIGNIGINYMPWWNAESGSKTQEPEITIKFDLFNDNSTSAMRNFIFVNTIVPNNKWLQYNMFQHSSCLYDVKIEGLNRLFACAGEFNVTYEGVLRDPPRSWISHLAYHHLNKNMVKDNFLNNAIKNRLIKIPDVYRVELKFQSLLPANFNNFIFTYAQNANHMDKYANKVYDPSTISELLPKAISKYTEHVSNVYKAGDMSDEDTITKQEQEAAKKKAAEEAEAAQFQKSYEAIEGTPENYQNGGQFG